MGKSFNRRALGKATLAAAAGALATGIATQPNSAWAYVETPPDGLTNMSPDVEQAWRKYLDAVEECRRLIFTREFSDRPQFKAEGNQFFMEAQAAAYDWVMAPRVDYPRFFVNTILEPLVGTQTGPSPDIRYGLAFIDGAQTYRIWGKRSNSRFLDLQLSPSIGATEEDVFKKLPTVPYPVDQMLLESDGSFEIIASPDHHQGNWIMLDPAQDRMSLLAREAFYDWANERPSLLRIERMSATPPRPIQWDEAEFIKHLEQSARFVKYMVHMWGLDFYDLLYKTSGGTTNTFVWPILPGNVGMNHAAKYSNMIYEVAPDEALIIESEVPSSKYWSFCLMDRYTRTTDFTYHQSSLNGHQARIDSDGKFRAVLAQRDPGVPNWLDPVDIVPLGVVQMRQYFQETTVGLPTVRKVTFDAIRRNLPADTAEVSASERASQIHDRTWAVLGRFGY